MQRKTLSKQEIRRVLQEKIARYLNLQQTVRTYQLVYEVQRNQLEELLVTKDAVKNIKKNNIRRLEGFTSLGSGVFIHVCGDIGEKILVNVGANIGVYMPIDEAISVLESREEKLKSNIENTARTLHELITIMTKLEQEIAALQQYLSTV